METRFKGELTNFLILTNLVKIIVFAATEFAKCFSFKMDIWGFRILVKNVFRSSINGFSFHGFSTDALW